MIPIMHHKHQVMKSGPGYSIYKYVPKTSPCSHCSSSYFAWVSYIFYSIGNLISMLEIALCDTKMVSKCNMHSNMPEAFSARLDKSIAATCLTLNEIFMKTTGWSTLQWTKKTGCKLSPFFPEEKKCRKLPHWKTVPGSRELRQTTNYSRAARHQETWVRPARFYALSIRQINDSL